MEVDEKRALDEAKKGMRDIQEVEDVPDNAIQVNVFTHDSEDKKFQKSCFYTESEAPPTVDEIESHLTKAGVPLKN